MTSPSPAPSTSATLTIRVSGGCNNTVSDALVAAIRAEVIAQTLEADRASVKVTLGSCSEVRQVDACDKWFQKYATPCSATLSFSMALKCLHDCFDAAL